MILVTTLNKFKYTSFFFWIGFLFIYLAWVTFFPELQILLIPVSLLFVYFLFVKPDYYIPFILLLYLVVVGEISPILRFLVHVLGFISLSIFLYMKKEEIKSVIHSIDRRIKSYLMFFFLIVLTSSILSELPRNGIEIFIKEIYFFFIVFSFYAYIKTRETTNPVIFILMIAGIIMSLSSIANLKNINFVDILLQGSASFRTGGILSNVNALSGYIVVVFPLFILSLLLTQSKIIKSLIILGILILILGVLATISRSAGLSIILGFLFFSYKLNKKVAGLILLSIFVFISILLILPTSEFILSTLRIEQGFSQRDYLWQLSFDMFKDNWLLGVGPGLWGIKMFNYSPVLQDSFIGYLFYDVNVITGGFNNSHNYYLLFMSDMGLGGLFLALYLPYVFFSIAKENIDLSRVLDDKSYLLNLALMTVGVSMFIRAFFEGISIITFGWVSIDLPFWTVFTLLIYNNYKLKTQYKTDIKLF